MPHDVRVDALVTAGFSMRWPSSGSKGHGSAVVSRFGGKMVTVSGSAAAEDGHASLVPEAPGHAAPRLVRLFEGSSLRVEDGLLIFVSAPGMLRSRHGRAKYPGFSLTIGVAPSEAAELVLLHTPGALGGISWDDQSCYAVLDCRGAVLGYVPTGEVVTGGTLVPERTAWFPAHAVRRFASRAGLGYREESALPAPEMEHRYPGSSRGLGLRLAAYYLMTPAVIATGVFLVVLTMTGWDDWAPETRGFRVIFLCFGAVITALGLVLAGVVVTIWTKTFKARREYERP